MTPTPTVSDSRPVLAVPRTIQLAAPLDASMLQPEKLRSWHRERLAVVYVRQSTAQQESTRLQYGLVARAEAWGWPPERVLVIDDDLGKSGTSAAARAGFQRLVSEVNLGHVGRILGVEMSRLARSNAGWHRLLEVCALFGTLIADLDGIYDPTQYNDQLLLGLKGTMSEAELHLLKRWLQQGCLSKARRGQLTFALPTGYAWGLDSQIQCDPDEQVQHVVRLIFHQFDELGTLGGLLRYLARNDIRIGVRIREGPSAGKGQLVWCRPNWMTLQNVLKHPLYAGAYVYGRRHDDPRHKQPGRPRSGRVVMRRADWHAFLPDHCPAYISWDQYERNLARLAANRVRADATGAVRDGPALLAGLVVCALCRARLAVHYAQSHCRPAPHTYECTRQRGNYGGRLCQHIPGLCLDTFVSAQVLAALEPAALELSLAAAEQVEQERATLLVHWQQRRERAAYEADRAARQYQAVEPESRLLARTLERAWEEKLEARQQLEEECHRVLRQQPRGLSDAERAAIRQLAADIPALWAAPTTTAADRKEVVRQVVERVEVAVQGTSEQVQVCTHWVGGGQTEGMLTRPIARVADRSDHAALCERVRTLTEARWSVPAIARQLGADGYAPWRPGRMWSVASVLTLRRQLGLVGQHQRGRSCDALGSDEWWAADLARTLGVARSLLHTRIQRGLVPARQEGQGLHRWIAWADAATVERLPSGGRRRGRWRDHRSVINGIIWKLRTGAPWRDLPERGGGVVRWPSTRPSPSVGTWSSAASTGSNSGVGWRPATSSAVNDRAMVVIASIVIWLAS